jgi:hypothetical protein
VLTLVVHSGDDVRVLVGDGDTGLVGERKTVFTVGEHLNKGTA